MADSKFKWYVLRAISGKENKVKEYIESALVTSSLFKEYVSQVLIPTEKVVALRGGKRTVKERNLLPGYVLVECYLCDESYPLLRNIPNVLGFMSNDGSSVKPAPVPQSEINRIVGNVAEEEEKVQLEEVYFVGEKVKIIAGPFSNLNCVIQEVLEDKHKLKVVVPIFDRQTPLELNFNEVEKE